jgi:hypothetical protein
MPGRLTAVCRSLRPPINCFNKWREYSRKNKTFLQRKPNFSALSVRDGFSNTRKFVAVFGCYGKDERTACGK